MQQESTRKSDYIPLYIHESLNVKKCTADDIPEQSSMTSIVNALIEMLNGKDVKLPKYLVVVIDKDMVSEIAKRNPNLHTEDAKKVVTSVTGWIVR